MVGTVTHVVTGVKVSSEADCPVLPEIAVKQTRVYHRVRRSRPTRRTWRSTTWPRSPRAAPQPFVPFKTNSVEHGEPDRSTGGRCGACSDLKADEFKRSYHRRSNVESAIGSIKARCGGLVRSRTAAAQCNEVLCKVLLHNLACIVHAIEKYGIGVSFPLEAVRS